MGLWKKIELIWPYYTFDKLACGRWGKSPWGPKWESNEGSWTRKRETHEREQKIIRHLCGSNGPDQLIPQGIIRGKNGSSWAHSYATIGRWKVSWGPKQKTQRRLPNWFATFRRGPKVAKRSLAYTFLLRKFRNGSTDRSGPFAPPPKTSWLDLLAPFVSFPFWVSQGRLWLAACWLV